MTVYEQPDSPLCISGRVFQVLFLFNFLNPLDQVALLSTCTHYNLPRHSKEDEDEDEDENTERNHRKMDNETHTQKWRI